MDRQVGGCGGPGLCQSVRVLPTSCLLSEHTPGLLFISAVEEEEEEARPLFLALVQLHYEVQEEGYSLSLFLF